MSLTEGPAPLDSSGYIQGSIGAPLAPPAGDFATIVQSNLHGALYDLEARAVSLFDFFTTDPVEQAKEDAKEATENNIQLLGFLLVSGLVVYAIARKR